MCTKLLSAVPQVSSRLLTLLTLLGKLVTASPLLLDIGGVVLRACRAIGLTMRKAINSSSSSESVERRVDPWGKSRFSFRRLRILTPTSNAAENNATTPKVTAVRTSNCTLAFELSLLGGGSADVVAVVVVAGERYAATGWQTPARAPPSSSVSSHRRHHQHYQHHH